MTGSFDVRGEVTFGTTNLVEGGRAFFLAKYDSAGGLAWVRQGYGTVGTSIALDAAGDVYTTVSPPFIHKYDAAGNLLWTKDAGPGQFTDSAIAVAPDGSLYVTTDNVFLRNHIRSNHDSGVFFRKETHAMAAHRNRLVDNVIEDNGIDKEAPGIRVRGETRGLELKGNVIRDTRKEGERKQVIGVLIEEEAGAVVLEGNVIDAKTKVEDRRRN